MNYLIYGNEQYLINEHIKRIIKENKGSLVLRFDGSFKEDPTNEVISNYKTDSLFGEKTLILFKNPIFLINKCDSENIDTLINLLKEPDNGNIIVFYSSYSSFRSKLKVFKAINETCETHYYEKFDEDRFNQKCNEIITKSKIIIDDETRDSFIKNCGNDLEIFCNSMKTLLQYGGEVNNTVLEQLTYTSDDFDKFSLINSIIARDVSKSKYYINKLKSDDSSIFGIISLLSSQLMYLYSVSYYSKVLDNERDILDATKTSNPYRLKMAYKTLNNISQEDILKLINKLAILDYEFKTSSTIDHSLLFDIFISTLNS